VDGSDESCELPAANWIALALRELLSNAGRAAGNSGTGSVELAWQNEPFLQLVVANNGASFPDGIPVAPPVPFRTAAPSRDGIGLAIVHRLCLALGMDMLVRTDLPGMTAVVLSRKPQT
jgi:signal transduction histidine kinase